MTLQTGAFALKLGEHNSLHRLQFEWASDMEEHWECPICGKRINTLREQNAQTVTNLSFLGKFAIKFLLCGGFPT